MVPACRTLDCVSVFALTVPDAAAVLEVIRGPDPKDAYSRAAPPGFAWPAAMPARFRFGVPRPEQREFFGDSDNAALYEAAIHRLTALGGAAVTIDLAPFLETAALVYRGAWLAERLAEIDDATGGRREMLLPVTRRIIEGGAAISGADAFRDWHRRADLKRRTRPVWDAVDLLVVPTTGTIYRITEIEADPIGLNLRLGHYTNFVNLLDLAALAVPAGFRANGLPTGMMLIAPAFHDPQIAAIGAALHEAAGLPLGARPSPSHASGLGPSLSRKRASGRGVERRDHQFPLPLAGGGRA
jgi:allophanate hydrolase